MILFGATHKLVIMFLKTGSYSQKQLDHQIVTDNTYKLYNSENDTIFEKISEHESETAFQKILDNFFITKAEKIVKQLCIIFKL